jgi:hypothetical protein
LYKSVYINIGTPACHIYWYVLIQIDTYMAPVDVYSIYMGVRYIGINGVYHIYPSTLLIVFPDVLTGVFNLHVIHELTTTT